jgi:hypothetical protein
LYALKTKSPLVFGASGLSKAKIAFQLTRIPEAHRHAMMEMMVVSMRPQFHGQSRKYNKFIGLSNAVSKQIGEARRKASVDWKALPLE